jgi:hypothetical protein
MDHFGPGALIVVEAPPQPAVNFPANRLSIRMHELSHDECRQGMAPMFLIQLEIDMNIVKSREGMAAILASLALASVTVFAQAPGGGPPGGGFGGPATKETVIQRNGLGDAALKLTDAQKAAIDKLAEKNAVDSTALQMKYPAAAGGAPNPDAQAARTKLREDFTAEVNKVLNAEQRTIWAARPQGGRGGGGGGPSGGGAPRGAGGPPLGGA